MTQITSSASCRRIIFLLVYLLSRHCYGSISTTEKISSTARSDISESTSGDPTSAWTERATDTGDHDDNPDTESHDSNSDTTNSHATWQYYGENGPSNWDQTYKVCNSSEPRQSPVNIVSSSSVLNLVLADIDIDQQQSRTTANKIQMTNNGHTVNLVFPNTIEMIGGTLGSVFRMAGLHFHWGEDDTTGSEHTIDGKRYPLEMHVVFYDNERYVNFSEAVNGVNSLAVLGVLFQITSADNEYFEPITSQLNNVKYQGQSTELNNIDLFTLLPYDTMTYYRYFGSLTTPPCTQNVLWTIFQQFQGISDKQLQEFRSLYRTTENETEVPMSYNWRPTQNLYNRQIYRNFLLPGNSNDYNKPDDKDYNQSLAAPLTLNRVVVIMYLLFYLMI